VSGAHRALSRRQERKLEPLMNRVGALPREQQAALLRYLEETSPAPWWRRWWLRIVR
jgi:hypothetical protein